MADLIKTGLDIRFQYPLCGYFVGERNKGHFDRVVQASPLSKPVGMFVRYGFRDGPEPDSE